MKFDNKQLDVLYDALYISQRAFAILKSRGNVSVFYMGDKFIAMSDRSTRHYYLRLVAQKHDLVIDYVTSTDITAKEIFTDIIYELQDAGMFGNNKG